MTTAQGSPTPAGWYPDPAGTDQLRWWDGGAWTAHLAPRPVTTIATRVPSAVVPASQIQTVQAPLLQADSTEPYGSGSYSSQTMDYAPPIRWNTVGIWIMAVLPVATMIVLFMVAGSIGSYLQSVQGITPGSQAAQIFVSTGLGFFAIPVVALVIYLIAAVFDRRSLREWGYSTVTAPWWVFLNPLVYFIIRTVRVRRESRHGVAPLVVYIVLSVVSSLVVLGSIVAAVGVLAANPVAAEKTTFEHSAANQLSQATGHTYLVTCGANFSLTIGSQFLCSALDETSNVSHSISVEMVAGANNTPTPKIDSVTPPITP